jgi:hypothetical protein
LRILNITAAFLVVVCNLVVSFNHSLELFLAGGFTGGLEYVAVVAVEVTFLMGGLNIVASRLKGVSPGAPAVMGGLLGVLLVSWSNVAAGWAYGVTGVLLGLATPMSLLVAEAILSRAILQRSADTLTAPIEVMQSDKTPIMDVAEPEQANPVLETTPITGVVIDTSTVKETATIAPLTIKASTPIIETVSTMTQQTPTPVEDIKPAITKAIDTNEGDGDSLTAELTRTAIELRQQIGKWPSRKTLADACGVTQHRARVALDTLKQQTATA